MAEEETKDDVVKITPLNECYYISDFKREALPDRTPLLYTQMTEELQEAMNKIPDKGAAIISNYLKMNELTWIVQQMARDGSVLSVTLNNTDIVMGLKDDNHRSLVNTISNGIGDLVMKWYGSEADPFALLPIYGSGLEHIPDSFVDMIHDTIMSYDQKTCNYYVMLKPEVYVHCVDQKRYIRHILTDIMKSKKVMFYDDKACIIAVDKNEGKGPTAARAHALCCGVVFTLFGIINTITAMKEYNDRISR